MKMQIQAPTQSIDNIIEERDTTHSAFSHHADISQRVKDTLRESPNWGKLSYDKREAMETIVHKLSRILNGKPEYVDAWHDISRYATLVVDSLEAAANNGTNIRRPPF